MWQKTIKSSLLVDHHWLDWALGCWAAAAAEGNWMRIKRWEREVAKTETEWENRIIEQLLNQNRESISPGEKLLRCSLHFETCCAADALLWQFKRAVSLPLNLNSNQRHVSTCKSIMYVFWWLYKCAHAPARNSPPPTSSIIIFREREWNTIWNLKEFIAIHPSTIRHVSRSPFLHFFSAHSSYNSIISTTMPNTGEFAGPAMEEISILYFLFNVSLPQTHQSASRHQCVCCRFAHAGVAAGRWLFWKKKFDFRTTCLCPKSNWATEYEYIKS